MKVKFLLCMVLSIAMIACSKDDDPLMDGGAGNTSSVVINADGSTSTGAVFSMLDDTSFFLDYIKYKVVDSHLEIVGYDPYEIAPDVRPYASVTLGGVTYATRAIAPKAFSVCKKMRSIVIPQSVTSIGYLSFNYCSNLTDIVLHDAIKEIGHTCFKECTSLTEIIIPNSVKVIDSHTFLGCIGLKKITLPNSITEIRPSAFLNCSYLEEITLPNSIKIMGEYAFKNCRSLKKIIIPPSVHEIYMNSFIGCSSLTDLYYTGEANLNWEYSDDHNYFIYHELHENLKIHMSKEHFHQVVDEDGRYYKVIDDYPSNIIISN